MPSNGTALNQQRVNTSKNLAGKQRELWLKPMSSAWEADDIPVRSKADVQNHRLRVSFWPFSACYNFIFLII
jgi:hypothetical protein